MKERNVSQTRIYKDFLKTASQNDLLWLKQNKERELELVTARYLRSKNNYFGDIVDLDILDYQDTKRQLGFINLELDARQK